MAGTIYNNLQTQKQKDWYRDIAQFGDKKEIPLDAINAVLLLGNLESRGFRPDAESGTGASGLYQFIPGRWTDITDESTKYKVQTRAAQRQGVPNIDWVLKKGQRQ
jgi:hypothetical protein